MTPIASDLINFARSFDTSPPKAEKSARCDLRLGLVSNKLYKLKADMRF